jgi:hypothetical protein
VGCVKIVYNCTAASLYCLLAVLCSSRKPSPVKSV